MNKLIASLRKAIVLSMMIGGATVGCRSLADENNSTVTMLIEPGVCVGPVKAGMSIEQVIGVLGKPDTRSETALSYPELGLEVVFKTNIVRVVICGNDGPASPPAEAFKGLTKEGVGIGSSRDEVIRAFGEPGDAKEVGARIELLYKSKALNFSLNRSDGKVVCIQAGFPAKSLSATGQKQTTRAEYSSPEAAFESFKRAANNHDVKAILDCFSPEDQKAMEPQWQKRAASERDKLLTLMAANLEGLRITGKKLVSDSEIVLTMSHSNEPARMIWFKKSGVDWKLWSNVEMTTGR